MFGQRRSLRPSHRQAAATVACARTPCSLQQLTRERGHAGTVQLVGPQHSAAEIWRRRRLAVSRGTKAPPRAIQDAGPKVRSLMWVKTARPRRLTSKTDPYEFECTVRRFHLYKSDGDPKRKVRCSTKPSQLSYNLKCLVATGDASLANTAANSITPPAMS